MKKLRELLSDTLVYGISSVLARFINYLLVPLHTKVFETAQYGVVSLIYAAITFLNVIFTFGMESAYLRYAKDREHACNVFKTIQISLLIFASLLALCLWIFAPLIMPLLSLDPETKNLYLMMVGIIWFDTLSLVPFAELRLVRKSFTYAAIRTVNVGIVVGLNFYLILSLSWGIEAVFFANLLASAITTVFVWMLTARMLGGDWDLPILRRSVRFGMPFVPAGLGYAVNEVLDRFFLNRYLSDAAAASLYGSGVTPEDVVGIYSACYKMAVFMLLLIQMFRMAWQPFFLRHADDEDAPELYADVFLYFNAAAAIIFLGVSLFVKQIVQFPIPFINAYLIDPKFWSGLSVVPVLLGAYWFHGWYMNFSAGIFIKEKTKILPVITFMGAGITIVANLMLLPYFGMMGAASATLLSYALMAILLYRKSTAIYAVDYPLFRAFLMMGVCAGCLFALPGITQWSHSEWTGRFLLLLIGSAGITVLLFSKVLKKVRFPFH